jgi:hypothetical protein
MSDWGDLNEKESAEDPPESITCPDCLGVARLSSYRPHEGWQPGDIATYRCVDCLDRWDIELPED